jgi:4,5-DOPA dioxygenase extradiol
MNRRRALQILAAMPTLATAACSRKEVSAMAETGTTAKPTTSTGTVPALFIAHGAPVLLDEAGWVGELAGWAKKLPRPESVLMVSAHWEKRPATLGATTTVPLVYDFYGFPEKYYQVKYPAPGAPALAKRVKELLGGRSIATSDAPERGLDHGAYVPLVAMYPEANVPVLQLSLPSLETKELFEMGRALAPLRKEGVLVVGSGFLTHNMRYAFRPGIPDWAREFDAWAAETLTRRDIDALCDFEHRAPAAKMALPTTEHFVPVVVAAGAASDSSEKPTFPITGWWMNGAFTRRSVEFG